MHTIKTNIDENSSRDAIIATAICRDISQVWPGSLIYVDDNKSFLRVKARCNGAALMALTASLMNAGYVN